MQNKKFDFRFRSKLSGEATVLILIVAALLYNEVIIENAEVPEKKHGINQLCEKLRCEN